MTETKPTPIHRALAVVVIYAGTETTLVADVCQLEPGRNVLSAEQAETLIDRGFPIEIEEEVEQLHVGAGRHTTVHIGPEALRAAAEATPTNTPVAEATPVAPAVDTAPAAAPEE